MQSTSEQTVEKIIPTLTGVPETMLWTLFGRCSAAGARQGPKGDLDAQRIFSSLDYDFHGVFGEPFTFFSLRSKAMDQVVRRWLKRYPNGLIVSLGEGLETQASRVDNGRMRWLSIDLPEGIELRERFLPNSDRIQCLATDVFDLVWMDRIDASAGLFIIAQGLFMYFDAFQVQRLFVAMAQRFPGAIDFRHCLAGICRFYHSTRREPVVLHAASDAVGHRS